MVLLVNVSEVGSTTQFLLATDDFYYDSPVIPGHLRFAQNFTAATVAEAMSAAAAMPNCAPSMANSAAQ